MCAARSLWTLALPATAGALLTVSTAQGATVAHWRFDEGSGQVAASVGDVAGNYELTLGPSASAASDPIWVTPGRNGAGSMLQFVNEATNTEGGRDFLIPSATSDVSGLVLSSFTLEAWINLASIPGGFTNDSPFTIINLIGDNAGSKTHYQLRVEAGSDAEHGKLTGLFQDAGGTLRVLSHDIELVVGEWVHVAFGRDSVADVSRLWVNGVAKSVNETNDPITALTSLRFAVGAEVRTNGRFRSFNGLIDDVRISDRLLDTSELLVPEPASATWALAAAWALAMRRRRA